MSDEEKMTEDWPGRFHMAGVMFRTISLMFVLSVVGGLLIVFLAVSLPNNYSEPQKWFVWTIGIGIAVLGGIYPYRVIRNLKEIGSDIAFDRSGLKPAEISLNEWSWEGGVHVLLTRDSSPDDLSNIDELRDIWRRGKAIWSGLGGNRSIIEFERVIVDGREALRVITKEAFNFYPGYKGTLKIPFQDRSYWFTISAREERTVDKRQIRDFIIFQRTIESGGAEIADVEGVPTLLGWYLDHHDAKYDDPPIAAFQEDEGWHQFVGKLVAARSLADDEMYDNEFPEHALTKVRRMLKQIQNSMVLSERLKSQAIL